MNHGRDQSFSGSTDPLDAPIGGKKLDRADHALSQRSASNRMARRWSSRVPHAAEPRLDHPRLQRLRTIAKAALGSSVRASDAGLYDPDGGSGRVRLGNCVKS